MGNASYSSRWPLDLDHASVATTSRYLHARPVLMRGFTKWARLTT